MKKKCADAKSEGRKEVLRILCRFSDQSRIRYALKHLKTVMPEALEFNAR